MMIDLLMVDVDDDCRVAVSNPNAQLNDSSMINVANEQNASTSMDDIETIKALRKEALGSIYSWINDTYFVYTDRIKAAQNVDLMGDIKSETFNRFNDTPQASSTGFDDDAHATNTTKTITSSAGGTAAARLSEVYRFIRNQYKLWADEFIQKFTIIE